MTVKRKITDMYLVAALITLAMFVVGEGMGQALIAVLNLSANTNPAAYTFLQYFSFIGMWIFMLIYLLIIKKERPLFKAISSKVPGNSWKNLIIGFLVGGVLNGLCGLIAVLHGDIRLHINAFNPVYILLILFAIAVQSGAEEIVCRGFFYRHLRRGYKTPAVAIIGNSLLFGLLHMTNNGATVLSTFNVLLAGALFSVMVYYFDSLWMAIAAHTAWNFTQNILLGLPNSGLKSVYSVFGLESSGARNSFAYDTAFGIEGTWIANIVLSAAIIALIIIGRKRGARESEIWEPASEQTAAA